MGCLINLVLLPITFPFLIINLFLRVFRGILIFILVNIFGIEIVTHDIPTIKYVSHKFNRDPESKILLEIEGRHANFIVDWIMSQLGLNNRSYIRVTDEEVRVSYVGIFNTQHEILPLTAVNTTYYQFQRRFRLIVYAFLMICWTLLVIVSVLGGESLLYDLYYSARYGGIQSTIAFTLVGFAQTSAFLIVYYIAVILALAAKYYFSREFFVGFSTANIDDVAGISFAWGIGGNIPYDKLKNMFEYVNRNVLRAHQL